MHFKLLFIVEMLTPIEAIQKQFELSGPLAHEYYYLFKIKLFSLMKDMKINEKLDAVLKSFSLSEQNVLKRDCKAFCEIPFNKWSETTARNLDKEVFGENGLLKKCLVFNPFMKSSLNQSFDNYVDIFDMVPHQSNLEQEFNEYIIEDTPQNPSLSAMNYWLESQVKYPSLAKIEKTFLSLSCTSLDAERSFSRCRDVLTLKRTNLKKENLRKYVILYFNGDIERIFDGF